MDHFRVLCIYGSTLGIIPHYDFEKCQIGQRPLHTAKAILLTALLFPAVAYTMYSEFLYQDDIYRGAMDLYVDIIKQSFLTMHMLSVVFGSSFIHRDKWLQLHSNLELLRRELETKKTRSVHSVAYFSYHIISISCCMYYTSKWFNELHSDAFVRCFPYDIVCNYYESYTSLLICNVLLILKQRYENLRNLLNGVLQQARENRDYPGLKSVKLAHVAGLLKCLNSSVLCFNGIFGWALLFIFARNATQIVITLNYTIELSDTIEDFQKTIHLSGSLVVLVTFVQVAIIVMACDSVKDEKDKFLILCDDFEELLLQNAEQMKELLLIEKRATIRDVKFSAAGFFEVNKTSLLGILGTTMTYFVIVNQFLK